jgi:putative tricarboxylic transport membrane protein
VKVRERKPPRFGRACWRERSELGICASLAAAGLLALVHGLLGTYARSESDLPGAPVLPTALGVGLLVLAVPLTVDVLRGGRGEQIGLSATPNLRAVGMLAGVVVAGALLTPILGWPLAGAGLIWGSAYLLGARSFPRTPLVAAGISLLTWIVFDLPGSPLMGLFGS